MSVSDILKTRCLPMVYINPLEEHCSREDAPTARSSVARLSDSEDGHAGASDEDDGCSSSSEVEDEKRSDRSDTAVNASSSGGDDYSQYEAPAMPESRAFTMASGWFEKPFVTEGPHFELYMKLWNSPAGEAMGDPWKQSVFVRKNMRWWTEKSDGTSAQDYKPSYETDKAEISGINIEVPGGPALPTTRVVPYLGRPWEL